MRAKDRFFVVLILVFAAAAAGWVDPLYERHDEGIRLYERGDFEEAVGKLKGLSGLTDEPAIVRFNLGNAWYKLGDYESAMSEYFRAARSADTGTVITHAAAIDNANRRRTSRLTDRNPRLLKAASAVSFNLCPGRSFSLFGFSMYSRITRA